ncbi:MAG: WG repeat-containing protein, partial [Bacteroidales bacterium]|nr:WG repeat-containing protein [Bacteroidales bacterium]
LSILGKMSLFGIQAEVWFTKADMVEVNIARVKYEKSWAYINKKGEFVMKDLRNAENFINGYSRFREGKLFGFIDSDGNIVVKPQYTDAKVMTEVCD